MMPVRRVVHDLAPIKYLSVNPLLEQGVSE